MLERVRVARRAVELALGEREQAEFGHICFAQRNEARGAEFGGEQGIARARDRRNEPRALPRRHACGQAKNILEEERHAGEGGVEVDVLGCGAGAGAGEIGVDHEIKLRVEAFHGRDRGLDEFARADLFGAD